MKILVTGANGNIGRGVVDRLLADGHRVIAADLSLDGVNPAATLMESDIFSADNPFELFGRPDALLHLAWRNGFNHSAASHLEDLPKHYDFIRKMIDAGIKQVCVMGSMHEIGRHEGAIDEMTPANPQSLYGISKNALRTAVQLYANAAGTVFQWTRGYYIVTNSSNGASVFSKIVQAAERGDKRFPLTTGTNKCDFIDYTEFCRQVAAVVEQREVCGIINCCSGKPTSLRDAVEQFVDINGYDVSFDYGAYPDRPYDSKAVWGDNSKIELILNNRG